MFEDIFGVLHIRASGWCQLRENLELQSDNLPDESGGRQPVHLLRKGQQGVPRAGRWTFGPGGGVAGKEVTHASAKLAMAGSRPISDLGTGAGFSTPLSFLQKRWHLVCAS